MPTVDRAFLIIVSGLLLGLPTFARAADDECGGLKVPGYTAKRLAGPFQFHVAVTPSKERLEDINGPGAIRIINSETSQVITMNPKTHQAFIIPTPNAPPQKPADVETYMDKKPAGKMMLIEMGMKNKAGKFWVFQVLCRPDGIWTERKNNSPQGIISMSQTDIKTGNIPNSEFEVPSNYKIDNQPNAPTQR